NDRGRASGCCGGSTTSRAKSCCPCPRIVGDEKCCPCGSPLDRACHPYGRGGRGYDETARCLHGADSLCSRHHRRLPARVRCPGKCFGQGQGDDETSCGELQERGTGRNPDRDGHGRWNAL